MAKSNPTTLLDRLKSQTGWVFLAGMALLLAIRVFMVMNESDATPPPVSGPEPPILESGLSEDAITRLVVERMIAPWGDFQQSDLYLLGQINMFDPKLVQNAPERERTADQKVEQAMKAFRDGDLQQALSLVNDALDLRPNHIQGRELRQQIQQRMMGATDTGATTGSLSRTPTQNLVP
jgi:hypothetical protein